MRVWHEDLVSILCQKHLCALWHEGLIAYSIITNPESKSPYRHHPAVKEFQNNPDSLWQRLELTRNEMLKRNYHPKEMPMRKMNMYGKLNIIGKEYFTLAEQIETLKQKRKTIKSCKCKI